MAQHPVAKVTGTVDGFLIVTGILTANRSTRDLANFAINLLRAARQVLGDQLSNFPPVQLSLTS